MTKAKTTKRALLLSGFALLICVSMLIGSTFAWFTDDVVSANNIIKSGKLDVTMEWANGTTDPDNTVWTDASTGPIFTEEEIWEPGYVSVRHIKIANAGNLALKYQLHIVANGEVSKLADVIDVYYADPAVQVADRTALTADNYLGTLSTVLANLSNSASGALLAGKSDTITIALKMKESAGNEYQDLSIGSDFAIKLVATQLTSEKDSFDDQYDKMATVDNVEELKAALAEKSVAISLGANIELTEGIVIAKDQDVAINLMGYTLKQAKAQTTAYAMIDNNGTLTILDSIGSGKISYADIGTGGEYASNTISNKGTLNVKGGTVENTTSDAVMSVGYPHAIDCYQGSVTNISGGTVKSINYDAIRMFCNSETLATEVNISGGTIFNRVSFQDPNSSKAGYGRLNISGGTFVTTEGVTANVRLLNFCNVSSNMKATVTGGTFDKGFKTQNYASIDVKTSDWLNYNGADAVATTATEVSSALANGGTIVLAADVVMQEMVSIPSDKEVVLDLNGKTLAGAFSNNGGSALIKNSGSLTIKNGTVVALAEYPDVDWGTEGFPAYATNTISNSGKLVIEEGAVIENQTLKGGASYAIDCYPGSDLIVNGGTIKQTGGDVAIRMFANSNTVSTKVTINSGSISGKRAIWVQLPSSNASNQRMVDLTINGGTLSGTQMAIYSYSYGDSFAKTNVTITGGTFNGDIQFGGGYKGDTENVTITGGTFNGEVGRWVTSEDFQTINVPTN